MKRPSGFALLLAAAGFPLALVPALADPQLWPAWLGYAALLVTLCLADAALALPRAKMQITLDLPRAIPIGRADVARLDLRAERGAPRRVEALPEIDDEIGSVPLRRMRFSDGVARAEWELRPTSRGAPRVRNLWLRWTGPLGLVWSEHRVNVDDAIAVAPDVGLTGGDALRLPGRISEPVGSKVEHFIGDGSEFESLREYVPGLDRRAMDWKASARHHKLLSREFRAERDHQVILAFDSGRLMAEPLDGIARLDRAINAALRLAAVGLKTGDRVGMFAFDEKARLYRRPEAGLGQLRGLRLAAATLGVHAAETNFTLGIVELSAAVRRRSLVILFTDFVDSVTAELMVSNLDRLARRHLVLFVALRDPAPTRLAHAAPASLRDLNRAVVAADLVREREKVLQRLRRAGVLCLDVEGDLGTALVNRYLEIKRRELL